jgi:hypothetical protein
MKSTTASRKSCQPKILIWALAKESGKFEKELRYPGENDVYENPRMDALHL